MKATKAKSAAAAGAPPQNDDNVSMAGGDGVAVAETDGAGVVDEYTVTPIFQDDGQRVHELADTPKPKKKDTKHAAKVLNMLEKDQCCCYFSNLPVPWTPIPILWGSFC